jgi:hypothetical protein
MIWDRTLRTMLIHGQAGRLFLLGAFAIAAALSLMPLTETHKKASSSENTPGQFSVSPGPRTARRWPPEIVDSPVRWEKFAFGM